MRNDGVWELDNPRTVATTQGGDARRWSLLKENTHGGLLEEDYFAFRAHPMIAWEVADMLIEEHFPDTYRDDILRATGFVGGAGELWRQRLRGVDAGERTGALGDLEVRDDAVFEVSRRRKRTQDSAPQCSGRTEINVPCVGWIFAWPTCRLWLRPPTSIG